MSTVLSSGDETSGSKVGLGLQESGAEAWVVRLYGDSLGLPRHDDSIPFHATYAELFCAWLRSETRLKNVSLYNRSQGGATAPQLAKLASADNSYFGPTTPQLVILQCGICDCAPRPIPLMVRHLIGRLPGRLQGLARGLLHRHRAWLQRHGCVWKHTEPEPFRQAVTSCLKECAAFARAVLVVNIAPPTEAGEAHSPGLVAGVNEYNKLLRSSVESLGSDRVALIDVHTTLLTPRATLDKCINQVDGHHLSASGHQLYFSMLKEHFIAVTGQVHSYP